MLDLAVGEVAPGLLLGMEKMNVGSGAACPGSERAKLGAEFDHASSPTTGFYLSLGVPRCLWAYLQHLSILRTSSGRGPVGAGAASIPPARPATGQE